MLQLSNHKIFFGLGIRIYITVYFSKNCLEKWLSSPSIVPEFFKGTSWSYFMGCWYEFASISHRHRAWLKIYCGQCSKAVTSIFLNVVPLFSKCVDLLYQSSNVLVHFIIDKLMKLFTLLLEHLDFVPVTMFFFIMYRPILLMKLYKFFFLEKVKCFY